MTSDDREESFLIDKPCPNSASEVVANLIVDGRAPAENLPQRNPQSRPCAVPPQLHIDDRFSITMSLSHGVKRYCWKYNIAIHAYE